MNPVLKRGDGLRNTPHLAGDVMRLQGLLHFIGPEIGIHGRFDAVTERSVRAYQRDRELTVDGIVGPQTWGSFDLNNSWPHTDIPGLETFHGDLEWIHKWEGHVGRPYWPGGRSGVTWDPGCDFGYQSEETVKGLYKFVQPVNAWKAALGALGLRGHAARDYLAEHRKSLSNFLVSSLTARGIFPHIAVRYWKPIGGRFPVLREPDTPGSVQTALLSLAYNRGARNKGLKPLAFPLRNRAWLATANHIADMQQDHKLRGVRRRRREEAELIRLELEI